MPKEPYKRSETFSPEQARRTFKALLKAKIPCKMKTINKDNVQLWWEVPCHGIKEFGGSDLDGGVAWAMFPCVLSRKRALVLAGIDYPDGDYSGVGQYFSQAAGVQRTKRRTLVTQSFGWDV